MSKIVNQMLVEAIQKEIEERKSENVFSDPLDEGIITGLEIALEKIKGILPL